MFLGDIKAGAVVYNEGVAAHQLLEVLPAVYVLEAVRAHDDGELLQRELFCEVSKRIYGIRRLWQVELHIAGPELRVILYGQVHQVQAVIFIQQGVCIFKRVVRRYYEPYLVYLAVLYHVISYYEMTSMYGIETTEV